MAYDRVFYDAACPICVREMQLLAEDPSNRRLQPVPIQGSEALLAQCGITPAAAMTYLHIMTADGRIFSGMPAVRQMYAGRKQLWWLRLAALPVLRQAADRFYPWFARNRYRFPAWLLPRPRCADGVCGTDRLN